MKANREHRIPLSDAALAVLAEAAKLRPDTTSVDAPVFPGAKAGRPLSNMALLMLLRRMGRGNGQTGTGSVPRSVTGLQR